MTDQQFINQLGLDLSTCRPTMVWTQEPIWYKKTHGVHLTGHYNATYCGGVLVLGRCLSVQMGADAADIFDRLRAKGYEVVEAFDNGHKVR
jgi:hypothetical protein